METHRGLMIPPGSHRDAVIPPRLQLDVNPSLMGLPGGSAGKESIYSAGDLGPVPGLGRSPGEGND